MLNDFHIHSYFSGDSDTSPVDIIEKAILLHMEEICFTDHNDFDYPGEDNFILDTDKYFKELTSLKEIYKDTIKINIGLEVGLEPYLYQRIEDLINSRDFDFVIGSSHLIGRKDPYYKEFFEGRHEKDCFEEYFISIIDNLKKPNSFDVYGHIDYIVRYPDSKDKFYSYREFKDLIDEILRLLIHNGKGIEINAGGFRNGLTFPNPHPDIIKRYKELGGEIITVGSDAHTTEYIGKYFNTVKEMLKACGYGYYTTFHNRKPEFIKLI